MFFSKEGFSLPFSHSLRGAWKRGRDAAYKAVNSV